VRLGAAILQFASACWPCSSASAWTCRPSEQAGWMSLVAAVLALFEHREVQAPVPALPIEQRSPVKASPVQAA
jgi:hypothetical protein